MLEKENYLREYKYWSYEKDQNYPVFNVVCDIKFFDVWINSKKTINNQLPVNYLFNI